jgi:hypothetical protein
MFEVEAITRLAKNEGKTYGINAIILTHGETDADNTNYLNDMGDLHKVFMVQFIVLKIKKKIFLYIYCV